MYQGDILDDTSVDLYFNTSVNGVPTTLSGTPAVSIYKDNGTTEFTTGVTLTADFDSRTGLNQIRIVTTDAAYATGGTYHVIITTGTVGGVSVVGTVVGSFTIEHRKVILGNKAHGGTASSLRLGSTTSTPAFYVTNSGGHAVNFTSSAAGSAGMYLGGSASDGYGLYADANQAIAGEGGDYGLRCTGTQAASLSGIDGLVIAGSVNGITVASSALSGILINSIPLDLIANLMQASHSGTAQAGSGTSITLAAGASASNDYYNDMVVAIYDGTGAAQTPQKITAYNGTTKVATTTAWTTAPDNTSKYVVIGRQ